MRPCVHAAMRSVAFIILAALSCVPARAAERPPQFVVMAFDNCTELARWQELTDFAAEMNKDGERLHFTFFVSGINFIEDASRAVYEGPHQKRGTSRINFGGSADEVGRRVDYVNALARSGHEIASHAVGHFDGAGWSAADWEKEFRAFDGILRNTALAVRAASATLDIAKVIGFRAPYLATSPGLYTVLKSNAFRYDASRDGAADEWPERIDGIWRFNLARLRIAGSGRSTLSMDYNFFAAQSGAVEDAGRAKSFREQMLATYLEYFRVNYRGNRAPLHIGHHFFPYQGGAYNAALKDFARTVCGLPEVRCVSYAELADFLDRQSTETREAYRKGDFPRAGEAALRSTTQAR